MSEKSRMLRKGARFGVLGSPSDLCIAAPLAEDDYDPAAHTDAARIGWYFDRTASAEKMGAVVMGTDILSLYVGGLALAGYMRPGNTADTTAGNIRWTGSDLEVRRNSIWRSTTQPAGRVIAVDPAGGGEATTIAAGIAAANALAPSSSDPVTILVSPGIYTNETNPLVIPGGVSLVAVGDLGSVVVEPATTTTAIFDLETGSTVANITARGANGVGGVGFRAQAGNNNGVLAGCSVRNCETGLLATGTDSVIAATGALILRLPGESMTDAMVAESGGRINTTDSIIIGIPFVSPLACGTRADGAGSLINLIGGALQGATSGVFTDDGGLSRIRSSRVELCSNALHIGSTGTGSRILAIGVDLEDNTNFDINIEAADGTVDFSGFMDTFKRSLVTGAVARINVIDRVQQRGVISGGVSIEGGADIGTPGTDLVFVEIGEGGPYIDDQFGNELIEFWSYDASATSGSRFTRFASNAGTQLADDGDAIIIGGKFAFAAIQLDVSVVAAMGTGSFIAEYWDGSTWVAMGIATYGGQHLLVHRSNKPLLDVETQLIEHAKGINTDWAAANDVTDEIPAWDNGADHFAVRLRNDGAITSGAQFTAGKARGNDVSMHSSGDLILWGESRGLGFINQPSGIGHQTFIGANSSNILYGARVRFITALTNFADNTESSFAWVEPLPSDIDTSTPIRITARGIPETSATGDVELELDTVGIAIGDIIDGTLPESQQTAFIAVTGTAEELFDATFELDISAFTLGQSLGISIYRNAKNGNADDTYPDNFVVTEYIVEYTKKRLS